MSVSETYRRIAGLHDLDAILQAATIARRRGALEMSTAYASAATRGEVRLDAIWREVLEIDEVGIDDNFFELGGDSLQVAQMLARIVSESAREVPAEAFLEGPTIRQLAAWLGHDDPGGQGGTGNAGSPGSPGSVSGAGILDSAGRD